MQGEGSEEVLKPKELSHNQLMKRAPLPGPVTIQNLREAREGET